MINLTGRQMLRVVRELRRRHPAEIRTWTRAEYNAARDALAAELYPSRVR